LSSKNDVNVPSKNNKQKNLEKEIFFVNILNPAVRGMDIRIRTKMSWIRNTAYRGVGTLLWWLVDGLYIQRICWPAPTSTPARPTQRAAARRNAGLPLLSLLLERYQKHDFLMFFISKTSKTKNDLGVACQINF
jgi:hypothetical protein